MSRDVAADNILKALLPLVVFGVATGVVLTTMAVMAAIRKTPHKSTEDCPEIPSECTPCVAYAGIAQIEALMDPGEVHSTPQYQFPAPVGSVRREAGMTFESLGPNFHAHSAQQLTLSENGWSATIGTLGIGVAQMTPIDFPTWEEHGELQNSHLPTSALMDKHTTFALCQWDATLGAGRAVMFDTSHDLATTTRFDPREAIPVYCQDGVDPDFRRGTHSHPTQCLSLMTYLASNEPGCALLGWAGGDRVGMMVFSTAFCSNDRSPRVVPRRRLPYAFHTESDLAGLSTAETVLAGNHIAFWAFSDTAAWMYVRRGAACPRSLWRRWRVTLTKGRSIFLVAVRAPPGVALATTSSSTHPPSWTTAKSSSPARTRIGRSVSLAARRLCAKSWRRKSRACKPRIRSGPKASLLRT